MMGFIGTSLKRTPTVKESKLKMSSSPAVPRNFNITLHIGKKFSKEASLLVLL